MESRIPVPTDNIFKFYALFGLLLLVFSCGSSLYENSSANEVVFSALPELEALKRIAQPSPAETSKITLLQKKLEITKLNRDFFDKAIGILGGLGLCLMIYGFYAWHTKLQPVLDRTAQAQLEIAELQLAKLRREVEALGIANSKASVSTIIAD